MEQDNSDDNHASRAPGEHAENGSNPSTVVNLPNSSPADNDSSLATPAGANNSGPRQANEPPAAAQSSKSSTTDAARTHRTWAPKYGRVQKCDFCNGRSPGTLQSCSTCDMIRICEDCARSDLWRRADRVHFIDPNACDWTVKTQPRKRKGRAATEASTPASTPGPSEPRLPPARRRKMTASVQTEADSDEDDYDGDADWVDSSIRPSRSTPSLSRPSSSNTRRGSVRTSLLGDAARPSLIRSSDASVGQMERTLDAPDRSQRNMRQAAARALEEMSQQSRLAHRTRFDEDGADEAASDNEDDDDQRGLADNVNNRGRRGNQAPRDNGTNTGTRTHNPVDARDDNGPRPVDVLDPLVAAGLPAGTRWGYDILVDDVYRHLYGNRPEVERHRPRTSIPDRLNYPYSSIPTHARQEPGYDNGYTMSHHQPPVHQHHRREEFGTHLYDPNRGPPPQDRNHYEYSSYPAHPHEFYHPTSRTTPRPHPFNGLTPEEQHNIHMDNTTLAEMQRAWREAPRIVPLRHAGFHLYAIDLLWDVYDIRRRRVVQYDDSNSRTVRWFVETRDYLVRIQHGDGARDGNVCPGSGQRLAGEYHDDDNGGDGRGSPAQGMGGRYARD